MKKILWLLPFVFMSAAHAQTSADIQKIENYLNSMTSMKADFVQMASNGSTSEGVLYISKPSKIRMEYAQPTDVLIVGNGDEVIFNDKELDQVTNIDYDDIPGTKILTGHIKIDGQNLKVTDFYKDSGSTTITLEYAKAKDMGPITLVFNNSPFELKQWKIIDPQSVEVTISLYELVSPADLKDDLFVFHQKAKSKSKGRR